MRSKEGMKVANAMRRLRDRPLKLGLSLETHPVELWRAGRYISAELVELCSVTRITAYRAVQRTGEPRPARVRHA